MSRLIWEPGDLIMSQCVFCAHKHASAGTCDAYPEGIPDVMLLNQHDHRLPFEGDRGIQFREAPEVTEYRKRKAR
jgi:hypothetical protein